MRLRWDANGDTTVYAYDLNNRRLTESHESVAGSTKKRKFTKYFYDFADRLPFLVSSFSINAALSQNPLGLIEGIFNVTRGITGEMTSITGNSGIFLQKLMILQGDC